MIKGKYTRDFYLIPTILIHNGDGLYKTIECIKAKGRIYVGEAEKFPLQLWSYGF